MGLKIQDDKAYFGYTKVNGRISPVIIYGLHTTGEGKSKTTTTGIQQSIELSENCKGMTLNQLALMYSYKEPTND